jgi:GT2 family glycosyltransferase
MPISVIIPSYKTPQYLDLALKSAYENQTNSKNQIIAIIDGFPEMYDAVLKKYPGLDVLVNEQNKGQTYCHNTGVMLAEHEQILVVNDDNVFPARWDERLEYAYASNAKTVITPNQMEPSPSIFKSFIINDLGTTPDTFRYDEFIDLTYTQGKFVAGLDTHWTPDGQTWPLCMSKTWYMILGGIDPNFPSPAVADWDFFLRCELAGLNCVRYHGACFYHFAGASTKLVGDAEAHNAKEQQSYEYFAHKWGYWPTMRADTHSHINSTLPLVRGVRFLEDGP